MCLQAGTAILSAMRVSASCHAYRIVYSVIHGCASEDNDSSLVDGLIRDSLLYSLRAVQFVLDADLSNSFQESLSACPNLESLRMDLMKATIVNILSDTFKTVKCVTFSGPFVESFTIGDDCFDQLQAWPCFALPSLRVLHVGIHSFPSVSSITVDDSSVPRLERLLFDASSMKQVSSFTVRGNVRSPLSCRSPRAHRAFLWRVLLHASLRQRLLPCARFFSLTRRLDGAAEGGLQHTARGILLP